MKVENKKYIVTYDSDFIVGVEYLGENYYNKNMKGNEKENEDETDKKIKKSHNKVDTNNIYIGEIPMKTESQTL